ncbi:MAG TPA: hypothetical protein DEP18_01475 [Flavobacteriales bacterium]|nr:hypothetical protein [Flavobacteriales bacterium]HRE74602.1 hypothetical protein [Flavobacteriales bacterium]HRJ39992.1 hypothetical protein [Flavobacteriales bacterium]
MKKDPGLWNKIERLELDDPQADLTFSGRLARENGWSLEFALGAIEEYKRFIYLICVSNTALTPSDEVDQVWHLHLLYTESYWDELCTEILGRKIHHGPTKGGNKEREKFEVMYERTLRNYEEEFGISAPEEYWPSVKNRFSDIHFRRTNTKTNWIIPKPFFL